MKKKKENKKEGRKCVEGLEAHNILPYPEENMVVTFSVSWSVYYI